VEEEMLGDLKEGGQSAVGLTTDPSLYCTEENERQNR
jgi:hypothetical protein